MRRQGTFLVSCTINDMTVDQLRRTAVGPQRWRRMTQARAAVLSLSQDRHRSPAVLRPSRLTDCTALLPSHRPIYHLVPGGRFLVIGTVDTKATVRLWDLGSPLEGGTTNPVLLACHDVVDGFSYSDDRPIRIAGNVCVVGETELQVVVTYSHPSVPQATYVFLACNRPLDLIVALASALVLSVSLDDAVKMFKPLGTIHCAAEGVTRVLISELHVLLLLDNKQVILWNYHENQASVCHKSPTRALGPDQVCSNVIPT